MNEASRSEARRLLTEEAVVVDEGGVDEGRVDEGGLDEGGLDEGGLGTEGNGGGGEGGLDRRGLELLRATGVDRVGFLHRLLTADVAGVAPGRGCHALLLNTKGHVVAELRLLVEPEAVRLVVPAGQGDATAAALARYAVMDDFVVAAEPGLRCLALLGPRAKERLLEAGVTLPEGFLARPPLSHASLPETPFGPLLAVRVHRLGADGVWIWAPPDRLAALVDRLAGAGVLRLSRDSVEIARLLAQEPAWGAEITPEVFPMEVGLSPAIDYAKGCYLGQEPIVRIRDRGHVNWRLVGLRFSGDVVPAPGDRLIAPTKDKAGRVTSAARVHTREELGLGEGRDDQNDGESGGAGGQKTGAVGLALLHVSVPAGTELQVQHGETQLAAMVVEA